MTKQTKKSTAVASVKMSVVDESELLLAYQRELDKQVLQANIDSVNNASTSQQRFILAINLLAQQDENFKIKARNYKSKQRDLLYNNRKMLYFTDNFVNVTKTQADKQNVSIQAVKKYNHAYCYNVAVETYKTYADIKALVMQLAQ